MDEYYELFMQMVRDFFLCVYIFILGEAYIMALTPLYTRE